VVYGGGHYTGLGRRSAHYIAEGAIICTVRRRVQWCTVGVITLG
jgi:hypothetical protein